MAEVGPMTNTHEAYPLSVQQRRQDQDLDLTKQDSASPVKDLLLSELDTTPLDNTPAPSEPSPQPQSREQSPNPEDQSQIREWHDGYKPARRQKKKPRPGESTFRVPMSMEQRKSLGASVRPKEPQVLAVTNGPPTEVEASVGAESPITPVTRGGTKLKFRAYGPTPTTINSRHVDGVQLSPNSLSVQQFGMADHARHAYINFHAYDINLMSAPLDNGPKLAWWFAQQISQMNFWQNQNNTASDVPEITASQFYGHDTSGHERRRQTDRERKARWREANAEKNRDNDLRARVKRQAKTRFGDIETPGMTEWIASEFTKRKARRADKQISQAAKSGHFPSLANSENIRYSLLRESMTYMLHPDVNQVRQLIIDVLFPVDDKTGCAQRHEAVQHLSEIIGLRQSQDDDMFQTALTSIAQDEMAFNSAKSLMIQFETEDDDEVEHDGLPPTSGQSKLPNQVFIILNEALAILTELKELGDKQQAILMKASSMNGSTKPPSQGEHRQYLKEFGMSETQLEDFLVLINGGPLEPDPDDDLAVELHGNDLDVTLPTTSKLRIVKLNDSVSDSDIWGTINSVLEALLERCILPPQRGRHNKTRMKGENHAKNQVAKVKALLAEIEIGGNRVRSRVESQAISTFYSRLTNFGKTQSFGGPLPQPQNQLRQDLSLDYARSKTLGESNVGRKRKYGDELPSVNQSPSAAMPLPNAADPFADDVLVAPPIPKSTLSPILNMDHTSDRTRPLHSPTTSLRTLPPPVPVEPQVQVYTGYPQFRS